MNDELKQKVGDLQKRAMERLDPEARERAKKLGSLLVENTSNLRAILSPLEFKCYSYGRLAGLSVLLLELERTGHIPAEEVGQSSGIAGMLMTDLLRSICDEMAQEIDNGVA